MIHVVHEVKGFALGHPRQLPNSVNASGSNDYTGLDSDLDSGRESPATDENFTNPLVSGRSVYVADPTGQPCESCCKSIVLML